MLSGEVTFPRFVGTAPGTATLALRGAAYPPAPSPFPYINRTDTFPTQAVWQPDPNSDNVKIAVPPNQWVTGPMEMHVSIPVAQRTMGPVPNDREGARTRNYLPLRKGWITTDGGTVFNLQGAQGNLGQMSTAEKWAIAASVISAVALGTSTFLAILNYRKSKRAR